MSNRLGYRGYVASRSVRGQEWPQHVQNLVIRDYAQRNGMHFLLSATEYAMAGCYMNLETVLTELPRLEGVLCFSIFMLPQRRCRRETLYQRVFDTGASIHGALENIAITGPADVTRLEDIFMVDQLSRAVAAEL